MYSDFDLREISLSEIHFIYHKYISKIISYKEMKYHIMKIYRSSINNSFKNISLNLKFLIP